MIEPSFERLAHEKTQAAGVGGGGGVAFVKVDLGAGMGNAVAAEYGVRVTPTFIFFRDGSKVRRELVGKCYQVLTASIADVRDERGKRSRTRIASELFALGDISS